ncbi:DUF4231 domain-containing protein [Nocardia sp. GCM10030253]|uniref:DUF4231 domain-containing protein n=1 Tax=Nocardia sp. GCM10030253 TaxID=3273404 RepID=UPI003630D80F
MTNDDEIVQEIWATRVCWSRTADRLKKRVDTARAAALILSGLGAIATTMTATLLSSAGVARTIVGIVGAVCLACATITAAHFLTPTAVRDWTRARAGSEGIKRAVYEFRASAGSGIAELRGSVTEIHTAAADLLPEFVQTAVVVEAAPRALTPEEYISDRVQAQIDSYYRPMARASAVRSRRLRRVGFALGLLGTIVAAVASVVPGSGATALAPWVAALTTLSGGVAAHLVAKRYDYMIITYLATASRLQRLVEDWRLGAAADWHGFVRSCEDVIATENNGWISKWSEPEGAQGR